jgi:HEAT repeat protein
MTDEAITTLVQLVADEQIAVEEIIANHLPDDKETAVSPLADLLQNQPQQAIRRRAALVLAAVGSQAAIPHFGQALQNDTDGGVRRLAIAALEKLDLIQALPYLSRIGEDESEDVDLRRSALYALGSAVIQLKDQLEADELTRRSQAHDRLTSLSLPILQQLLLQDDRDETRLAAAHALGLWVTPEAVVILQQALTQIQAPNILWSLISALRQINSPEAAKSIGQRLVADENALVRQRAAGALAQMGQVAAVPYLCHALIHEQNEDVRQSVVSALTSFPDWRQKTAAALHALQQSRQERATIDANRMIQAIGPDRDHLADNRFLLADYLIEQALAYAQEPRLTAILAALIIASAGGSMSQAGERLNQYQRSHNIPEEQLQPLRVEIGGATALSPILAVLQQNLEENFQKPIAQLNEDTQRMWAKTIWFAQLGFLARTIMSIVLFIVGVYLVLDSYSQVMAGNLTAEQLVGSSVSFASGIVTMLLMVYRGPLRQIRQSVSDLGIASAAFIAYIHRVLEISHTFSFYYLRQKIDFDEMAKSSQLIDDAMRATIGMLEEKKTTE